MVKYKNLVPGKKYIMPEPEQLVPEILPGKVFDLKEKPIALEVTPEDQWPENYRKTNNPKNWNHNDGIVDIPYIVVDYEDGPKNQMVPIYAFETIDNLLAGTDATNFKEIGRNDGHEAAGRSRPRRGGGRRRKTRKSSKKARKTRRR